MFLTVDSCPELSRPDATHRGSATTWRTFFVSDRADAALLILAIAAIASGTIFRLVLDWGTPLWVDEVWSGTLAMQPTIGGLFQDMVREIGGPIYYGILWLWAKLFGLDNTTLRLPSLMFALAAPVVALRWRSTSRPIRLVWASLLLLWIPIFSYATEARSYSLAYLLGAVQVVVAVRLLHQPLVGRAFVWSIVSTAAMLTHYHAALIVALQGAIFVILAPRAALRCWSALAPFAVAILWFAWQLPLLTQLSTGNIRWQPPMGLDVLKATPFIIVGGANRYAAIALVILFVLTLICFWRRRSLRLKSLSPEFWIAMTGLVATAIVFGLGFLRPSFAQRYLFPYAAAGLFAVALMADRLRRDWRWSPALVVALFLALHVIDIKSRLLGWQPSSRWFYSWQGASDRIAAWRSPSGGSIRRTVFFLDNPVMEAANPDQLRRVAGFFLARAKHTMDVRALVIAGRIPLPDGNRALIALAQPESAPGATALIWIYDDRVVGSAANSTPPDGRVLGRFWSCERRSHDGHISVLLCLPPAVP